MRRQDGGLGLAALRRFSRKDGEAAGGRDCAMSFPDLFLAEMWRSRACTDWKHKVAVSAEVRFQAHGMSRTRPSHRCGARIFHNQAGSFARCFSRGAGV
jgi:hypothetical protein